MVLCGGSKDLTQEKNEEGYVKESVYFDTSVVSYYTSKPSRDIIALAHRRLHGNGGTRL
jgi:predicted TIM-barrel fold metal-dependent hydrolase